MAYQIFSEGNDSGWNKIYYRIEYETSRNGTNVGIRWKINWSIARGYFYGYNINASVWTKGTNFGRIIKGVNPTTGGGEALFPEDGGFYWFNNGYTDNAITGCRIIINSTNGGNATYDTGSDRTVYAPTGFVPSTILSSIDFNIGNDIKITIDDITNINYNYVLSLDVKKNDGTWQNIASVETSNKNYEWNLEQYSNTLYSLLSTRNSAEARMNLTTKFSSETIGITQKAGTVYVTNSNPDVPLVSLAPTSGTSTVITETDIVAGFGPYNPDSNLFVLYKPASLIAKNGATIEKLIIEANGETEIINIGGV